MEEESIRIWLEGQDGQEREFEVIGTFATEEGQYIALRPMDLPENEVVLASYRPGEHGELFIDDIEDDEEYEIAGQVFEALFNGEAEIEDEEDEEEPPLQWELPAEEDEDEYCYEDREGRLFLFGEGGEKIFLDEWGNPLEEEPDL